MTDPGTQLVSYLIFDTSLQTWAGLGVIGADIAAALRELNLGDYPDLATGPEQDGMPTFMHGDHQVLATDQYNRICRSDRTLYPITFWSRSRSSTVARGFGQQPPTMGFKTLVDGGSSLSPRPPGSREPYSRGRPGLRQYLVTYCSERSLYVKYPEPA